jgi:hypothetical protein
VEIERVGKRAGTKQDKRTFNTPIMEYTSPIKKNIAQLVFKNEARQDALTNSMVARVRAIQTSNQG